MPWKMGAPELARQEFFQLALKPSMNFSELCRRFFISRKTGYKWLHRLQSQKEPHFRNLSRRPKTIHYQISTDIIEHILTARDLFPFWGAQKIKRYLTNQSLSKNQIPSATTINKFLKQNGLINRLSSKKHKPFNRFEKSKPNQLWQMDFKGYFSLMNDLDCHPFTVVDDHSRFLICLKACLDQKLNTVKGALISAFKQYGIPEAMLMDNGACWKPKSRLRLSEFDIGLMRLGIRVIHSHPFHPQTQGKAERLNRTLKEELLNDISMQNLKDCQRQFDHWRYMYNYKRPHKALKMNTPSSRYVISKRKYPEKFMPINYDENDIIRRVDFNGYIYVNHKKIVVGKPFRGLTVALRKSSKANKWNIFFCQQKIKDFISKEKSIRQGREANISDIC